MELSAVTERAESGDQDRALPALQRFIAENSQCFLFDVEGRDQRRQLGQAVLRLLGQDVQPACQLACLGALRILSREKSNLRPFTSPEALETLGRHAGIGEEREGELHDSDVTVEALKCLCNVVFNSPKAQEMCAESGLVVGLCRRIRPGEKQLTPNIRFFDCRLLFLLTALRLDIRKQLGRELRGVRLLTDVLEATLAVRWANSLEVAARGQHEPPLARDQTDCAMEVLKILFNITFDLNKRQVDEEDAALYRQLVAILRHCLLTTVDGEDRTEELHSHTVNLLGNLPLMCLDVLLTPRVQPGSVEYLGMNMDAVDVLLDFLEKRVDRGHRLKEMVTPALNLLTESARGHRETRKFLRMRVLPPLRDVQTRPEVGNLLRNKLVRLMTHIDTDVKHCAAELLFVLCKENVTRFVKYTGYGNAAGLLAVRGLMGGCSPEGAYSEDEDTDTEEYKEAKADINPVTGRVEERTANPMDTMTDEQKEYEAMKLFNMFDKLARQQIIQPMSLAPDGKLVPLEEVMHPLVEVSESDSDSD
ncbi:synembryn-A [Pristis pectinata]|uniref:synembryn-A n=1 Tax=Pristis pectinata TaxID=685728 RepID=UPI00223C97F2|nr:synembryn-A [Pristis pectinata]